MIDHALIIVRNELEAHLKDSGNSTHAALGNIDWEIAIPLCIGVIPGARIGAHVTINTGDRRLRYTVGAVLGVLAVVYAVGEVVALVNE